MSRRATNDAVFGLHCDRNVLDQPCVVLPTRLKQNLRIEDVEEGIWRGGQTYNGR